MRFIKVLKKKQHGRSMLEMLGVLAVIGVLSLAALAGFQYAMARHRANETIHDVMLRASNVPMIDEAYVHRPKGYEWLFAGLPSDGRDGTYYDMTTVTSDLPEYVFKVEIPNVPKKVCRQILALNPTDIDAIYVEGDKLTDSEACPNDLNAMAFYFDENWSNHKDNPSIPDPTPPVICVGSDCNPDGTCTGSDCTICVGKDCDDDGHCVGEDCHSCTGPDCSPDGECDGPSCIPNPPTPPLPEPDDSCTSTTTYQYGDKCQYTAQCCTNPVAENCPPVCVSKDCPVPPVCGACEKLNSETCACDPLPDCECPLVTCTEPCTQLNSERCLCEPIPDCTCPVEPVCSTCEDYTYDENHCPIACVQKECSTCPEGTTASADTDACGCSRCIPDDCDAFSGCGTCQDVQYDDRTCPVGCTTKSDACCGQEEIICSGECEHIVTDENGCATCEVDDCCLHPDADECRCTLECTEICTQLNSETCSCEKIPDCDPCAIDPTSHECLCQNEPATCPACQLESFDENGCRTCVEDPSSACKCCDEEGNCDPSCACLTCEEAFNSSKCLCSNGGCNEGQECVTSCQTDENGCVVGFRCSCELSPAGDCELGQRTCFGETASDQWCCDASMGCGKNNGDCWSCPDPAFEECGTDSCCSPDETCCQGACYDFTQCADSSLEWFNESTCSCICSLGERVCTLNSQTWCCDSQEECSTVDAGVCCEKITPEDCPTCSKPELRGSCYQCVTSIANGEACTDEQGQEGVCSDGTCVVGCNADTHIDCGTSTDHWCCEKEMTCGTNNGECCIGTTCCSKGSRPYYNIFNRVSCCQNQNWEEIAEVPGSYFCCGATSTPHWNSATSKPYCCEDDRWLEAIGQPGAYKCCNSSAYKAYWNGSSVDCCSSSGYGVYEKTDKPGTYTCCQTDGWLEVVNQPGSYHCCSSGFTPYWNGSSVQCCLNKSLMENPNEPGTYTCCANNYQAYWNGTSIQCCAGDNVLETINQPGAYACCSEGQQAYWEYGYWGGSHCCRKDGLMENPSNPGTYTCCTSNQQPYWDGENVGCCSYSNYNLLEALGQPGTYACCPEGQQAYWDGSRAECCANPKQIDGKGSTYACCSEDYQNPYYGTFHIVPNGIWTAYSLENGNKKYKYTTTSTKTVCCANNPNSEDQVCCPNGHVILSYADSDGVKEYKCAGDDGCQQVFGAGSWTIKSRTSDSVSYECGGDEYCHIVSGSNYSWTNEPASYQIEGWDCRH